MTLHFFVGQRYLDIIHFMGFKTTVKCLVHSRSLVKEQEMNSLGTKGVRFHQHELRRLPKVSFV